MMNHVMIEAANLDEALREASERFAVPVEALEYERLNLLDEDDLLTSNIFEEDIQKDSESVSVRVWVKHDALAERGRDVLQRLLDKMQVSAQVTVDGVVGMLQLGVSASADNNLLIGRQGETLEALEYFVNRVLSRGGLVPPPVIVDIEEYRQRRIKYLEDLARKKATRAVKTGKEIKLLPMKPHERKIMHAILADFKGIKTFSMGLDAERHIVISPSGESADPSQFVEEERGGRRTGGRSGQGGQNCGRQNRSSGMRRDRDGASNGGRGNANGGRGNNANGGRGNANGGAGNGANRRKRGGVHQNNRRTRRTDDRFFESGRPVINMENIPDDIGNRIDDEDRNV
ncbi:hypothetical protein JXA32_03400 [Candidatus Sumerlaeota bacterium]|nr:hypothetical protein [Candidatus Sumerlaeota bacterium]